MDLSHPSYRRLAPGQRVATSGEILRYAATAFGDKIGIVDGERQWTYAEIDGLANRFANAVESELAGTDGRVGIMARNSAEYVFAHFGTARTGRTGINIPTRSTVDELIRATTLTKPAILIVDGRTAAIAGQVTHTLGAPPKLVCIDRVDSPGMMSFRDFVRDRPVAAPTIAVDPDGPGSIVFSGGTTGDPKAALSTQRARAVSAMAGVEDFRIDSDVVAGFTVPFSHAAGLFSWFQPAVLAGCTGVIVPRWDPTLLMQLTERHRISMVFAVPAQLALLLNHSDFEPARMKSLTTIVLGGAAAPRELIERAEAALPWLTCARAYGSTETGHLAAQFKPDREQVYEGLNQPGGRLEIEVFRSPGVVAAPGEIGEVATRGPHLMREYLGDPAATVEYFKAGDTGVCWGWMGDLAMKHAGYISLVGRSKDVIISGGYNVYPGELEEALLSHSDVGDCAVFAMPDPTWGELPVAAIVAAGAAPDAEAIMAHVAGQVARHKRVRRVFFVERIPRTPAGKIQRHILRQQCLGG
ncbi:MAG: class I adenylate-forming enzyme family protein [Burkholderiales bacterium]